MSNMKVLKWTLFLRGVNTQEWNRSMSMVFPVPERQGEDDDDDTNKLQYK